MHTKLTPLSLMLMTPYCLAADTHTHTAPANESSVFIIDSPLEPMANIPPSQRTQLDVYIRDERDDNMNNQQGRLSLNVPLSAEWSIRGEYIQGLQALSHEQKENNAQLARVGVNYALGQHHLGLAIHQGEGQDRYYGATLSERYWYSRALSLETQIAYRDFVRESPDLQYLGTQDQLLFSLRWQQSRYRLHGQAQITGFYSQSDSHLRLGHGDGIRVEVAYQLFTNNPQHWLSLSTRFADYDQEHGLKLGSTPLPPIGTKPPVGSKPPPPPPAPLLVPKDAKEVALIWSYGLNNSPPQKMPNKWQPIAKVGISTNDGKEGYLYSLGCEGFVIGDDKLTLSYGERKNSASGELNQTEDQTIQQVELRYQKLF
ncbi:hypothetical protein [Agitococcus lubricus]|uniref:PelB C-terminal domain-containing protein n=1 Tax=Agitococcus lubricus TaxID=1077255 RepID=A0A2T5IYL3_9GAMM|nr:hypothetical protein [Agitococcus lubricus]PTQ89055.1 hypothetical protein C8N29_10976 [Agitococcus lubricus]